MWSSIRLLGTIRPTNRMLIRPSERIFSSAGRRGAVGDPLGVDGDRQHAGRREAHGLEFLPVELRVAEREIDAADQRPQLAPSERREPEQAGVVGREELRRRDVVVLQHAAARQRRERLGHRRGQREMEDRDVAASAPPDPRTRGRRRAGPRRSSARRDRTVPARAQHVAHLAGAVADRVPRCAAGTHWLTIIA